MAEAIRELLEEMLRDRPYITLYEARIELEQRLGKRVRNDLLVSSLLGTKLLLDLHKRTIYKYA